jgi:phospholipid/cholesterol/gamma-HCH transport system substrate-binding protein
MRANKAAIAAALVILLLVGTAVLLTRAQSGYQLKLVLPSAAQLVAGSPVYIAGENVGSVDELEVNSGKAIATLSLASAHAPLHEGTTSRVEWMSVLGERVVTLYPGPTTNAALPDGFLLEAPSLQIEVDQVLAAFDEPTRKRLNSLIGGLNGTLTGREPQVHQTLQTAGPSVAATGELLRAVGQDGPAIRELVRELHQVTGPLAQRQAKVAGVVDDLQTLTSQVAPEQEAIRDGLKELPSTLDAAKGTLDLVPPASKPTVGLLNDLRPAVDRLPSVAANLEPVLDDLRPVTRDLRPTLESLADVLDRTPGLLDTAHGTLPALRDTVEDYRPALAFLRPYAPELAGFATNWGKAFSGYDSQGHVWTGVVAQGGLSASDESTVQPVPVGQPKTPAPGYLANQPWTDANGSGMK